jgi:hypothetical protein
MTRISSFGLYECPNCSQIHIKPEYGSISIYVPTDLYVDITEIKKCQGCGWSGQFKDFKFVELRIKVNTKNPSKLSMLFRKILNKPYIENDVRKIYPLL